MGNGKSTANSKSTANNKSAEEIVRMEHELSKLEHKLQRRYSDMGKEFLELADQEQQEIDRLVDEIILIRKRLTRTRREIQCEACMTFNAPDSNYCKHCGVKLAAVKTENQNGNASE